MDFRVVEVFVQSKMIIYKLNLGLRSKLGEDVGQN